MKTVYILHHSYIGTPESGEIDSVHDTIAGAEAQMKKVLEDDYEATPAENSDEDYMYITTHEVKSKK